MSSTTPTKPKAAKAPQDRKPKQPTPSEQVDAEQEAAELRAELLADLPAMRPASRFRLAHRNAFHNLMLEATKSGAFDRDDLTYDLHKPADIEAYQKLQAFVESIDAWAETIADEPREYALWSEGKSEEHMLALFVLYREALGESSGSES